MRLVLVGAAAAALAFGSDIKGTYVEARTADVFTGPCFANAEVNLVGDEAVLGWKIEKGEYNGVDISGLSIVAAIKASGTLGDVHTTAYPVKSVLILDERATKEQQQALMAFARKISGDLLQDVVRTEVRPIWFRAIRGGFRWQSSANCLGCQRKTGRNSWPGWKVFLA